MAQMHQGNASFDGIEKVSREIITRELLRKEKLRLMYLKRRNQSQFFSEKVCLSDGPVIRFLDLFVVTSSIAKYQFKAEMRRRMGFYQSSFLNAACGRKIFQLDSNFPYGNSGSCFGILNLFHFLNQDGEVVFGFGTSTKSPEHLVSMFNKVVQYKQIKSDSTKIAVG